MRKRQNSNAPASAVTTSTSDGNEQVMMTRARLRGKKSATAEPTIPACSAVPAPVSSEVPVHTAIKLEDKVGQNHTLNGPEIQTSLEGAPNKAKCRQHKKKFRAEENEISRASSTSNISDQCVKSRSSDTTNVSTLCVTSRSNNATDIATGVKTNDQQKQTFWWSASSVDIFCKRNNPRNGLNCFFSKASFNSVMGFELSLEQKLINQVTKMKLEAQKQKQPEAKKEAARQPTQLTAAKTKEAAIQPTKLTVSKTNEEKPAQKNGSMFSKINFVKETTETEVLTTQHELVLPNSIKLDSSCVKKETGHAEVRSIADQPQNNCEKVSGTGFIVANERISESHDHSEQPDNSEMVSDIKNWTKDVASKIDDQSFSRVNTHEESLKSSENVLSSLAKLKSLPSPDQETPAEPISSDKLHKLAIHTGALPKSTMHGSPLVFEPPETSKLKQKTMSITTNVCGLSQSTDDKHKEPDLTASMSVVTKISSKYMFSGQEELSISQKSGASNSAPSFVFEKPMVNESLSASIDSSFDDDKVEDTCKSEVRRNMQFQTTEKCSNTNQISNESLTTMTFIKGGFSNLTDRLIKNEPVCENSPPFIDSNNLAVEPGLIVSDSSVSKRDTSRKHLSEAQDIVKRCTDHILFSENPEKSLLTPSIRACFSSLPPVVKEEKGMFIRHSTETASVSRSAQNSDNISASVDDFMNLASIPMKYTVVVSMPPSDVDVSGLPIDIHSASEASNSPSDTKESTSYHTVSGTPISISETQESHHADSRLSIPPSETQNSKLAISAAPILLPNTHNLKHLVSGTPITTSDTQEYNHKVSQLDLTNTLADSPAQLSPKEDHCVEEDTKQLLICLTNGSPSSCLEDQLQETGSQDKGSHVKDGLSVKDDVLSEAELAEDVGELCLVMKSLSSDEESNSEDDDVHQNEPMPTSSIKIEPLTVQQPLRTQTAAVEDFVSDNNVNPSVQQQDIFLKSGGLGKSHNLLSKSSPNFDQDFAMLQTKPEINLVTYVTEDSKSFDFDQGIMNDSKSAMPYNGNMSTDEHSQLQSAPAPSWSESDIPIFAIREDLPDPIKPVIQDQSQSAAASEALTASGDAGPEKGHKGFKKSDLTRDEHEIYLKLYNKYVRTYMHRGPPPVFTGTQQKELDVFEKLHRRVLREQQEFQNYLLENAKKNPKSYSFLKTYARNYATGRAKSYHLISKYLNAYSRTLQSHIPLSEHGGSVGLKFLETLLEVGVPPRIKLPDLKGKQNPVHVAVDVKKIDTHFPKQSKGHMPGYIHHEPVCRDPNIIKLAGKYDFQVAVSSSVLKCLLNNHSPSYERTWNIPVIVLDLEEGGKTKRIVYLNKPVFENDLHVKDYNTLFHKYALRSMVSQPRNKAAPNVVTNPKQRHIQRAKKLDDPFDMFSTGADTIETFGVGSRPLVKKIDTVLQEQTSPSDKKNCKSSRYVKKGHLTRGNFPNWDEVQDDNIQLGSFDISSRRSLRAPGQPGALKRNLWHDLDVTSELEPSGEGQPAKKRIKLENDTNVPTLNNSSANLVQEPQSDHLQSPLSPVAFPSRPASPVTINHCKLSSNQAVRQIPLSPIKVKSTESPKKESLIVKKSNEESLVPKETLLSPIRQRSSILNEAESPTVQHRRSARLQSHKTTSPSTPVFNPVKKDRQPLSIPEETLGSLFTPLDSILGPSFGQTTSRDELGSTAENASDYLPPTEVNSSIVYNLWSLGSVSLLIRTRCHGVLKDANKTRRVYFSPKMEFQSTYGYEQVTLHEIAKDWTACFFRPNTNLLRARINAFTSEILMFEELEVGQLLRTSLNFKPENKSEFLERVFQHLLSLPCGKYILAHEAGQDFCGIRGVNTGPRSETPNEPKKKKPVTDQLPWVPIDPTMMLPSQVAFNRIPATFLPKDVEVKKGNTKDAAANSNVNNSSYQGGSNNAAGKQYWKKKKNRKRRTEETLNKLYHYQDF